MADSHLFTEYVAITFDGQFWAAAEEFLRENMDDALAPVVHKNNLEKVAEQFLRDHYKKAPLEPIWVNPTELAEGMDLNVRFVNITKDGSIFGRSYFHECDTEVT